MIKGMLTFMMTSCNLGRDFRDSLHSFHFFFYLLQAYSCLSEFIYCLHMDCQTPMIMTGQ